MSTERDKAERLADEELMPLIGAKDPEAFEVFYDRHGGAAYSLAYRIVGERAAAEDVTQEAFISIWRSGARFDRTRGSVRSWMLSIVRNRAIDLLRSSAGKAPKLTFDDDAILEQRPSEELTEEEAMRHETADEVRGAIGTLPGEQSKVIELAYFGGFSQSEIVAHARRPARNREGKDEVGTGKDQRRVGGGTGMSDHDRFSEDLPAYMLGALENEHVEAIEAHIEDCEKCRSELRWFTPAVAGLPEAVERHPAPPALRDRIMGEVRSDAAEAGTLASPEPKRKRGGRRWLGGLGWRPAAGLAAVALLIVAFAGYEIGTSGDGGSSPTGPTIVSGKAPGVVAKVVREGEGAELKLANVKELPEGRVLEAWLQRGGEVEPVKALFVPDRDGDASTMIPDLKGVEAVLVTKEPTGGSEAPTSTPIANVKIPE